MNKPGRDEVKKAEGFSGLRHEETGSRRETRPGKPRPPFECSPSRIQSTPKRGGKPKGESSRGGNGKGDEGSL